MFTLSRRTLLGIALPAVAVSAAFRAGWEIIRTVR